jgi:hypothetical protein
MPRPDNLRVPVHDLHAVNRRMTPLFGFLAHREGLQPKVLDDVQLMRADQPIPRMPVLYEPGIVIVGQDRKRGCLGDRVCRRWLGVA